MVKEKEKFAKKKGKKMELKFCLEGISKSFARLIAKNPSEKTLAESLQRRKWWEIQVYPKEYLWVKKSIIDHSSTVLNPISNQPS